MSGFFKKIGKALGKIAKVVLPVVGAVTGIGAIAGMSKGVGAIAGIGGVLAGGKKIIDKVGVGAVNLLTGTTQVERKQVKEQKAITKVLSDKVDQVKRLVKAGATESEARAKVGLTDADLNTPVEIQSPEAVLTGGNSGFMDTIKANPIIAIAGVAVLAFLLLPNILKRK